MREFVSCPVACILILALGAAISQADESLTPRSKASIEWEKDPAVAAEQARKSGKPIIVYITADYCGYCRKMERESWSDKDVTKTVSENFVALKLDAEKHEKLVARLDVRAYPTTLVFGGDGKHITTAEGFLSRADLLKLLVKKDSVAKPNE